MSPVVPISDELLLRLQDRAAQGGCTVGELLAQWLDTSPCEHGITDRQMFDNNHAVQLLIDPDSGRIIAANQAAARFYGYSVAQLQAMSIQDIDTLTEAEIHSEMQRAHSQERIYFAFRHRLASGEVRCVDVYSGPVPTPQGDLLHSIIIDATERKRMETALRESEQRYRTVADFSADWTYWQKADGSLHYVSPVCEKICGWTPAELRDTPGLIEQMILPDDRPTWDAHFHDHTSDVPARQIQYRIRHRDGSIRWIEHTCRPVLDDDGQFDGYHVSNHDITRRIEAQEQALALALERERVQLLTTFIQNAAHEFRTPLTTISSAAHLLMRSTDPDYRANKAAQVEQQIERITGLVDMLLMMVKLEKGDAMAFYPLDLLHMLERVCADMRATYGSQPAIHCALPAALPPVNGHDEYLAYALRQVIDNACRFTPPEGRITVTAENRGDAVRLLIQDTGPGIPPEHMPHIFETFWRHDTAHSTPGLGLGLPLARKIIELHQGQVSISSQPGQGTRCQIVLPPAN